MNMAKTLLEVRGQEVRRRRGGEKEVKRRRRGAEEVRGGKEAGR